MSAGRCRLRLPRALHDDGGAATVEFVFLGVLILVPLFYVVIAIFSVQSNVLATTQAAREAGRAFATAPDVSTGVTRAQYAVNLALKDQNVRDGVQLRFIPVAGSCGSDGPTAPDAGAATLDPGGSFAVCVVRKFDVPAVPSFFEGASKTLTGRYVVEVDKFRAQKRPKS
ncbi:MAG TPA: hypothetical protein VHU91_06500 [Mycobacteriales bacterium]|nr:hypothetical protein [Mycobacteriales bacterium]